MKISVITVNYNDCKGLEKTIESVVKQDYSNLEFIIIDGGSSDGSKELIEKNANILSYWVSEKDSGIYNAMNKGIDVATGEYCIFMNSGDVFANAKSIGSAFSLAKGADIICGNTILPSGIKKNPDKITLDYLFTTSICHQSAFIKTSLLKKYHYDEKYRIVSDRKLFIQVLVIDNCSYESIDTDIVNYDVNGFSAKNRFLSEKEYQNVLEELIPQRILEDYGTKEYGILYGESDYEKLFLELKKRNYRKIIYTMTVVLVKFISLFKKSASFINHFPLIIK